LLVLCKILQPAMCGGHISENSQQTVLWPRKIRTRRQILWDPLWCITRKESLLCAAVVIFLFAAAAAVHVDPAGHDVNSQILFPLFLTIEGGVEQTVKWELWRDMILVVCASAADPRGQKNKCHVRCNWRLMCYRCKENNIMSCLLTWFLSSLCLPFAVLNTPISTSPSVMRNCSKIPRSTPANKYSIIDLSDISNADRCE
jgi:hypothetical protein